MDIKTKHRIIGVVVLIALAIIIIPLFFGRSQLHKIADNSSQNQAMPLSIPSASQNSTVKSSQAASTADLATQALQPATGANNNDTVAATQSPDQTTVNSTAVPTTTPDQTTASQAGIAPTNTLPASSQNSTTNTSASASAASATVSSMTPSAAPNENDQSSSSQPPLSIEQTVPRTKTGVEKKEYATAKSHSIKKHEKLASKWAEKEKIKPAALTHAWTVQLGSFSQKANAEKLIKQLRAKGYAAYLHQAKSSTGNVNRVFVGPELNKERADTLMKKLHQVFHLKGEVVEYKV